MHQSHPEPTSLLYMQESDALQSEVKLLKNERGRLVREVSIKQQLEEGFAQRAGQQAAALKDAQAKIATLEKSLQQVAGQHVACFGRQLHQ